MIKILFVCHGNICRSPMAEYILKQKISDRSLEHLIYVESAATSTEEIGNPVYPPAREELAKHGINCKGHHARQVCAKDYETFDYIIGMEDIHLQIMRKRFFNGDPSGKLHLCMDFSARPGEQVDDPWYTGDFLGVYKQIDEGCEGLLERVSVFLREGSKDDI
ncbi:MAG: low molecular weight phosphotyrosine protein phosphatase [Lachnospiraceae bacterium]|nr:low molecular weight phosphotyrosine protein phosphatase [Lachnospiraceae bacterium]